MKEHGNRLVGVAAGVTLATLLATACGSSDRIVGDDTPDTPDTPDASGADTNTLPDGSPGAPDASQDATADANEADVRCPALLQPPPSFCDGGPFAPTYNGDGCVAGFACAPVLCASAGGTCVALVPGACTTGQPGDASRYSCGVGVGVQCCLP